MSLLNGLLNGVVDARPGERITLTDVPMYNDWGGASARLLGRVSVMFYPRVVQTYDSKTKKRAGRQNALHFQVMLDGKKILGSTGVGSVRWALDGKRFPYDGELNLHAYRSKSKELKESGFFMLRLRGTNADAMRVWLDSVEEVGRA